VRPMASRAACRRSPRSSGRATAAPHHPFGGHPFVALNPSACRAPQPTTPLPRRDQAAQRGPAERNRRMCVSRGRGVAPECCPPSARLSSTGRVLQEPGHKAQFLRTGLEMNWRTAWWTTPAATTRLSRAPESSRRTTEPRSQRLQEYRIRPPRLSAMRPAAHHWPRRPPCRPRCSPVVGTSRRHLGLRGRPVLDRRVGS
jgi:hypothetical protein